MIRLIALSTALAGAVATAAAYLLSQPAEQSVRAAWHGTPEPVAGTESWPICTTMASAADETDWAQLDLDFAAGKKALAAGDWVAAIAALKLGALRDPRNADIQNYIGYAYHRLRQLEPAFAHFQQALIFNPRHRGAHQHLGESYLAIGNLMKAEEHLAALERACLLPCDEYRDLQRTIATYKNANPR